ncbi:hypothetical protein QBC46DRAFT_359015 [Diplogelasinospora grovesii]|uniref:Uncharacterized protein n=1 Tax=Diplogelasinospora grovesii TaxID=303347 RepID=A0AAN6MYX4_9PEZI|nr:hypothetical protein QBC46DRAFT_359015 [Diplogelasinospora grovesii]
MAYLDYKELRSSLYLGDPRLRKSHVGTPQLKGVWRPWCQGKGRVIALHLRPDESFGPPTEYTEAAALETHLQQSAASQGPLSSPRSVYLLEGLSGDLCDVLGSCFQLHPSLFIDHERLVPCADRITGESGGLPFLPSTISSRGYVSLKYHEPMALSRRPTGFRNLCDTSGRHLAVTRLIGELSAVAISRRKCTFWCKPTAWGGWNCLIICDPPIRRILTDYSGRTGYDVVTTPYNCGYLDFVPSTSQMEVRSGPPRSSLLEDLIFYLQNHSKLLHLGDATSLRVFAEKIVASQYLKLAEYLQSNIDVVQWSLSRNQDLMKFEVSAAKEIWSDIQAWERRVGEYQDDLQGIMLQLEMPLETPPCSSRTRAWEDSTADFQYLMVRFRDISQRGRALNSAVAVLASLAGNRASFKTAELSLKEDERTGREARTVKALTILGIVFLPLSFSASLFSMSESYLPGSVRFWLYLSVSLPLLALVVLIYSMVDLGHLDRMMHCVGLSARK